MTYDIPKYLKFTTKKQKTQKSFTYEPLGNQNKENPEKKEN